MQLLAMAVLAVQYFALFAAVAGLLQVAKVAHDFVRPHKHRRSEGSLMRRRAWCGTATSPSGFPVVRGLIRNAEQCARLRGSQIRAARRRRPLRAKAKTVLRGLFVLRCCFFQAPSYLDTEPNARRPLVIRI